MEKTLQKNIGMNQDGQPVYSILLIIGICHLLNDSLQAVIPAMFPILEKSLVQSFTQLGLRSFTLQTVSSVMQQDVGMYTDKRPMPCSLPLRLTISMFGLLGLVFDPNLPTTLMRELFIRFGSTILHPGGTRVAFLAAGA